MTSPPEYEEKKEKTAGDAVHSHPLQPTLRAEMEGALGRDLGRVRVHVSPEASEAAEREGARAFTRNQDVYFGRDEYRPESPEGKRLLAHELAHTAQQEGQGPQGTRPMLEAEAEQAAESFSRGGRPTIALSGQAGMTYKEEKGKATVPTIQKHPEEIAPAPPQGVVTGGGLSIPYAYNAVKGAAFVPLVLQVPEGVSVVATALSNMAEGTDFKVQNAEGSKARSVVISVATGLKDTPKIQATFTRGSSGYLVVFNFPLSGKS